MKIKTFTNETRVFFSKKRTPEQCVSVKFPECPNHVLFIDHDGRVTWFNDRTNELREVGRAF